MSAIGPKQTSASALHMSAFGGKADITFWTDVRFRGRYGGKADIAVALHMSAFDPKRTSADPFQKTRAGWYDALPEPRGKQ